MRVGAHDLPPRMRGAACKGSKRFTLGFVWSDEGVANLEVGGDSESLAPLSWLEGAARSHNTTIEIEMKCAFPTALTGYGHYSCRTMATPAINPHHQSAGSMQRNEENSPKILPNPF